MLPRVVNAAFLSSGFTAAYLVYSWLGIYVFDLNSGQFGLDKSMGVAWVVAPVLLVLVALSSLMGSAIAGSQRRVGNAKLVLAGFLCFLSGALLFDLFAPPFGYPNARTVLGVLVILWMALSPALATGLLTRSRGSRETPSSKSLQRTREG